MPGNGGPIRFGVFEVDLHSGELRKQGLRIKLRDQPFQILLLLLEHPGEVVSRDDLQKQLWPGDTFVGFDRGLNKAVNHLRDALGDSAESPRFIETLPKRGYRFIAPVDGGHPNGQPTPETRPAVAEQPDHWARAQPLDGGDATRGLKLKFSPMLPWIVAGVSLGAAGISVALLWRATRAPDRPLIRFSVDLGPEAIRGRAASGEFFNPVISPDGTRLVFPAKAADDSEQLAMRRLDQSNVTILAGTEGAVDPFFSPDGQWIGFFAGKKLRKIPLQGGAVVSLCDTAGLERGASWGEDGAIIANLDRFHLYRVPATGGEPQLISKPEQHGERTWRWPQVLPGGENVLFTGAVAASAGADDSANIEVLSLKSGRVKVVRRGGLFGRYLPSGHLSMSIGERSMAYRSTSGIWRHTARRRRCWKTLLSRARCPFPGTGFCYTRPRRNESPPLPGWIAPESYSGLEALPQHCGRRKLLAFPRPATGWRWKSQETSSFTISNAAR